jgi:hypothetical protein
VTRYRIHVHRTNGTILEYEAWYPNRTDAMAAAWREFTETHTITVGPSAA